MSLSIEDILTPERSVIDVTVSSKKKLLEQLSSLVAEEIGDASADDIYERLLARERMGSTGIGEGIAIPHCRLLQCQKALGVLLRLNTPIDYDSIDGNPVDLVFALLVPEKQPTNTARYWRHSPGVNRGISQLCAAPDAKRLFQRAIAER